MTKPTKSTAVGVPAALPGLGLAPRTVPRPMNPQIRSRCRSENKREVEGVGEPDRRQQPQAQPPSNNHEQARPPNQNNHRRDHRQSKEGSKEAKKEGVTTCGCA